MAAEPHATALIPALDTDDADELRDWAKVLAPHAALLKVGLQGFVALGPAIVEDVCRHAPVFLDLKLHDIPNTVAGAARAVAGLGGRGHGGRGHGVGMVTVHASGGPRMIQAAVQAAPDITILAVTILTSLDDQDLAMMGLLSSGQMVPRLAAMAVQAGAGGIVCAPPEIQAVRDAIGPDPVIVVPGIRPADAASDDQARVATPAQAINAGATHIVVGRPITTATDPVAAAQGINASLDGSSMR